MYQLECAKQTQAMDMDPDSFGHFMLRELDDDSSGQVSIYIVIILLQTEAPLVSILVLAGSRVASHM